MMRELILLILLLVTMECVLGASFEVIELPFDGTKPEYCKRLYVTSGSGKTMKEANEKVIQNVVSAGGNAVVYHGGAMKLDPVSHEVTSVESHAIIYLCSENASQKP